MLAHLTLSGVIIVLTLLGFAVVAAFLYFERSVALRRAHIDETDFIEGIFNSLGRGAIREALLLCDETPGPVARLAAIAIHHRDTPAQQMEAELNHAGLIEISRMERRISVLTSIAQIAPIIGLLGTVLAIFEALLFMERQTPFWQESDAVRCLASGVGTTVMGLLVAIPSYFGMNLLSNKIEKLIVSMGRVRSDLLARIGTFAETKEAVASAGDNPLKTSKTNE